MNTPVLFSSINPGGLFYMDHCPGNTYRKVDNKTAEFAGHRLGNLYNGCRITMGESYVRKAPFTELIDDPLPPPPFIWQGSSKSSKASTFTAGSFKQAAARAVRHKPCMVCDAPAPIARGICYACQPQTDEELLG